MNIIDLIERNQFLKQLFPDGLDQFFIGCLDLTTFDRTTIFLHTLKKPAIEIAKWGVWDTDYNVIVIELLVSFIKKLTIEDWQNNSMEICTTEIQRCLNEDITIVFSGESWKITMEAKVITFQGNSTYLLEE